MSSSVGKTEKTKKTEETGGAAGPAGTERTAGAAGAERTAGAAGAVKETRSWTPEQARAISERGSDMLVSAAAGAGKTAVMVERVVGLITDGHTDVTDMLIVTFTDAAAAEMKEKIRAAIRRRLRGGAGGANADFLREQLARLDEAYISTFHAFASRVIRQFFYLIDADPGFRVCDDAEASVLREDSLDKLFREEFAKNDSEFRSFLDMYTNERNTDAARAMITTLYDAARSLPDGMSVIRKKAGELALGPSDFSGTEAAAEVWKVIEKMTARAVSESREALRILEDAGCSGLAEKYMGDASQLAEIHRAAADRDRGKFSDLCSGFSGVTLRPSKDEKEDYALVKDKVQSLRDDIKKKILPKISVFAADEDAVISAMNSTAPGAAELTHLVERFDEIFRGEKEERGVIDFSDMETYCLDILSRDEAAEYYRGKFKYIFIDEYQDTSVIQEAIISRIATQGSLFMVGDIKQSIYGFREASPEIFRKKYDTFPSEPDGSGNLRIELNRNFRSRPLILDEINRIFDGVMDGYDENAKLYCGSEPEDGFRGEVRTFIVRTDNADTDENETAEEDHDEKFRNALIDPSEMTKNQLEALEAARIVRDIVGKPVAGPGSRPIKYSDIVIISRSLRSRADDFRSAFSLMGIPFYVDDRKGYLNTSEVEVFLNLLSLIDNRRQDVPLISALRSVERFSESELAGIRKARPKGSFADAAEHAAQHSEEYGTLGTKLAAFYEKLDKWREMSISMPLGDFIWRVLTDSGFFVYMGTMPDPEKRQANLRLLADRAQSFSRSRQVSLYDFLRYMNAMKKSDIDMPQAVIIGENDNVVRLMTSHHSKGLEYPVVIAAGMGSRLNYSNERVMYFDRELGIGLKPKDPKTHVKYGTLISEAAKQKLHTSEVEEELRVLYVALTRAKDRLYLLGTVKDADAFLDQKKSGITKDTTYFSMMKYVPHPVTVDSSEIISSLASAEDEEEKEDSVPENVEEEVRRRLDYEYAYSAARQLKLKYSVSDINREYDERKFAEDNELEMGSAAELRDMKDRNRAQDKDAVPVFIRGSAKINAARRGTVYHTVMQHIDMVRALSEGRDFIEKSMDDMVIKGIITAEEKNSVDTEKIAAFFRTDQAAECAEAARKGKLRREQPFSMQIEKNGEHCYVQGIIDCYYDSGDGLVLIDYKTGRVDPSKPDEEEKRIVGMYRTQMAVYGRALSLAAGIPVKKTYLYLFGLDKFVEVKI
jgi:ATP-dependent helicase/nuclease subunit A